MNKNSNTYQKCKKTSQLHLGFVRKLKVVNTVRAGVQGTTRFNLKLTVFELL